MKGAIRFFSPLPLLGFLFLLLMVMLPAGWGLRMPAPTPTPTALPTPFPTSTPEPSPTPRPALIYYLFSPKAQAVSSPDPGPGSDSRPLFPVAAASEPTSLHDPLFLVFDRPISTETISVAIAPATSFRTMLRGDHTLVLNPLPHWQPDAEYALSIRGDCNPTRLSFRTRPFASFLSPSTRHAPDAAVLIAFSYPLDKYSVQQALRLDPPTPYRLSWAGQVLSLEPEDTWEVETTYTLTLEGQVRDATGNVWEKSLRWTFRTRSRVLEVAPQGMALPCDSISITFDRAADRQSVEAAFHISPTVSGTFEWEGNQVRFVPTEGFLSSRFYQVSLEPTAQTIDGRPLLRNPLHWKLFIGQSGATVTFGYGPNVQVVDAAGPRRIQFSRWSSLSCPLFELYQLSPERLLSDYTSSIKGDSTISIEGLPLVRRWLAGGSNDEVALPDDLPPGLYVLSVSGSTGQGDRLLVILTHYALILKEASTGLGANAQHQVTGYATSISTNQPVSGMTIRLYDRSGRLYGQGQTDGQGRFETTVIGDTDPLLALGEVAGEIALCGFGPEWDALGDPWSWRGWLTNPPTGRLYRVYVYTDRPIYRPGQTVHVRAIVRNDDDAIYSLLPVGTPVTVRLRDARDNVLGTQVLPVSEFGTVYTSFALAEGGTLGTYNVEVVVGEEVTRQEIKVEEYRKPDYEVTITADQTHYLVGETMTVTVEANYYFGRPVSGASVALTIYKQAYDEWECGLDDSNCWAKLPTAEYQGTTDAQGRWVVSIPARVVESSWWSPDLSVLSLEATVEDGSGQSVSSHTVVRVHRHPQEATLFLGCYICRPGEEIPVEVVARDYRGLPLAGVSRAVGVYSWDGKNFDAYEARADLVTDVAGRARTSLRLSKPGWYRVAIEGGKAEGWIWIYDPEAVNLWADKGTGGLSLSADKPSYAVGETAQILVRSPVTGTALLTLERGRVRRMQPVELTGPVTSIALPIEADFVPNLFVTIQIYQPAERNQGQYWGYSSIPDAELLIAGLELSVPPQERHLQVNITPQCETYAPREEAVITIQVNDGAGRPVQSELSLAVVDEAIFALSPDLSRNPFDVFYGRRSNLVRTYHSLEPVRILGGAEMGGGGDGIDVGNPRRHFPDTAYWNPTIRTDAQGRAVISLRLPDSLTRWRLVARAVTMDTGVGQGVSAITVSQPLAVRPAIPRFLIQGDTFTLTTALHNYSPETLALQSGLLLQGLNPQGPLSQTLSLAAGETAPLYWNLEAGMLGTVTVTAYARGGGLSDAVQYNIPVRPFAVPRVESWAGEYVGEHVERVVLPENAIPEVSMLEIRLSPSVVNALLDGLEYLIDYPFG